MTYAFPPGLPQGRYCIPNCTPRTAGSRCRVKLTRPARIFMSCDPHSVEPLTTSIPDESVKFLTPSIPESVKRGAGDPQADAHDPPALPRAGHADTEARRSVLTALLCATLVTAGDPQAHAQDPPALPRASRRETGSTPEPYTA